MKATTKLKSVSRNEIQSLVNEANKIEKGLRKILNSNNTEKYLSSDKACKMLEIKEEVLKRWVSGGFIIPNKQNQFKLSDIVNLKKKVTK
jgi:hypothetical protein